MSFKAKTFRGFISQVLVLTLGHPMWFRNALLLREELWVLSFPPVVGYGSGGGIYRQTVSQPFLPALMWFPSHFPDEKGLFRQF